MRAVLSDRYGGPQHLRLAEVARPAVAADRVLLRVKAASLNSGDWRVLLGRPVLARPMMGGIRRPKEPRRGTDVAGVVESVGADVAGLAPGDEVFGTCVGAFAEYATPLATSLVPLPAGLTFEEAASLPVAGFTALQALRDKGSLEPGQSVLVRGAGGGVGTATVQLARALGAAIVDGVCGPHNVELVRSLGADRVADYTREPLPRRDGGYDLIVDVGGGTLIPVLTRLLTPRGTLVVVGSQRNALGHLASGVLYRPFTRRRIVGMLARFNRDDLLALRAFVEEGTLRPVIDRTYPLERIADAYAYVQQGHIKGKVAITV